MTTSPVRAISPNRAFSRMLTVRTRARAFTGQIVWGYKPFMDTTKNKKNTRATVRKTRGVYPHVSARQIAELHTSFTTTHNLVSTMLYQNGEVTVNLARVCYQNCTFEIMGSLRRGLPTLGRRRYATMIRLPWGGHNKHHSKRLKMADCFG